ncbi:MAG: nucleotidyltransferase domain-containing protein [Elusimicrobia bacterium]|nr:nucleotidyltransferase domain-containing protein [Elusimicrobiota bacterium]
MAQKLSALSLLNQKSPALVLRFLWKSRAEWSGREIARQTGLSAPACHQALKQLDARGLALFRRVSNVHLYKINSGNYLVEHVFGPLFETEAALPGQVLNTIKKFLTDYPENKKLLSVVIFGSMATGHERLNSDLDLLVVAQDGSSAKDIEQRIQDLRTLVYRRFSIPLSPYIQQLAEIKAKYKQKLPLILKILKEGQGIYGKDLKELLQ